MINLTKFINKKSCFIEKNVKFGKGVIIYPNVVIEGISSIGDNTIIYNGSYIKNSIIGKKTVIYNSYIMDSVIGDNNLVGPYACIRNNTVINNNIKVGAFVEIKSSIIDDESKVPHLSYIGDTKIGKNVNIGCGVVTANYDGKNKYQTIIGNKSFVGCNTNLIAPLNIGNNSYIAAGSTITKDVMNDEFAIARAKQENKMRRDL